MIAIMDLRGKLVGHGSPGFHFVKTALTLFFMTKNNGPWACFSEIYAIAAEGPIDNFFMIRSLWPGAYNFHTAFLQTDLFLRFFSREICDFPSKVRTKMAASAGHVDRIKYEYPNSLSIYLFHSSHCSRSVSHNPLSYLWHLQLTERWKKLSILITHHQRSRAQSKCLFLIDCIDQT